MSREKFKSVFGDGGLYPKLAIDEARQEFWWAISKYAPHVIEELKEETFETYKAAKITQRPVRHLFSLRNSSDVLEQAFLSNLLAWSKRWNLDADWCREKAFDMLLSWVTSPDLERQSRSKGLIGTIVAPAPKHSPPLETLTYFPGLGSREGYLAKVAEEAKRRIQADPLLKFGEPSRRKSFIDSICEGVEESYCIPEEKHWQESSPSAQPSPRNPALWKHIEWAVRARVCGESSSQIAEGTKLDVRTINKEVRKVLELIGLPTKPGRGRPPGRKNSPKSPQRPGHTSK